jgi:hypothetical protein
MVSISWRGEVFEEVVVVDMVFTFMTSSSLFSRFDRILFCRFFIVAPFGFIFAFENIFVVQDKPEVVMGFRKEQAGLRQANPCFLADQAGATGLWFQFIRRTSITSFTTFT